MVGRQHDREEVVRLLGAHSVVTLTGPGGVGKTRLALDIAAGLHGSARRWSSRSPSSTAPTASCQAVVSSLGLRISGEAGPDQIAAGARRP